MSSGPHESFMSQAIDLAKRGAGFVEPNPCVGAVVVKEGKIVGQGYHEALGGPHAEVNAIHAAGVHAQGADLYVTLEPCSTQGRTPPCSEFLVDAGIRRVFIGCIDPNPQHGGRALLSLKANGLDVTCGLLENECQELIAPFVASLKAKRPVIMAKWASTLDGKIATKTGDSKWITSKTARALVHEERARCDGILVGSGTILADDPHLGVRHVSGDSPAPIILDTSLQTPVDAKALTEIERQPIIYCGDNVDPSRIKSFRSFGVVVVCCPLAEEGVDLGFVLRDLHDRGFGRILVEGGARVLGSFFQGGYVDLVQVYLAPKVLGDVNALGAIRGRQVELMADTVDLEWLHVELADGDLRLFGRVL